MRTVTYSTEALQEAFAEHTVLTLPMVAKALGTSCRMTWFRKLKELDYRASYTHRGKYYALNEVARYDENGLWCSDDIRFSVHGTLSNTITQMIRKSGDGRFAQEIRAVVKIPVQQPLATLTQKKVLKRDHFGAQYLYLWPGMAGEQRRRRRSHSGVYASDMAVSDEAWENLCVAMQTLMSVLNDKQRRLYLGLESIRLGSGGDNRIAAIAGADPKTVAKGRLELLSRGVSVEQVRKTGAGRPPLKKKGSDRDAG